MVQRERQVDHILLVDATQLVEPLALEDLQVADASSLGQAWRVARQARSDEGPQTLPPSASVLVLTSSARGEDVQAGVHYALGGREVPRHWLIRLGCCLRHQIADSSKMSCRARRPQVEPHGSQGRQVRLQGLQELYRDGQMQLYGAPATLKPSPPVGLLSVPVKGSRVRVALWVSPHRAWDLSSHGLGVLRVRHHPFPNPGPLIATHFGTSVPGPDTPLLARQPYLEPAPSRSPRSCGGSAAGALGVGRWARRPCAGRLWPVRTKATGIPGPRGGAAPQSPRVPEGVRSSLLPPRSLGRQAPRVRLPRCC